MESSGEPSARGDRRRREILESALACFLEKGVEATTLGDIRARSGASTGSIYHLFSSKEEIAAALFLESMRDLHERLVDSLARGKSAEDALRGVVSRYVAWVLAEPDRARFLLAAPRTRGAPGVSDALRDENRAFLSRVKAMLEIYVEEGAVRAMPMDVFVAVVLGPMQEWARQHLAGIAKSAPKRAARELGVAAWNAVRAR
jgi:AcrR family transcriptional regulator